MAVNDLLIESITNGDIDDIDAKIMKAMQKNPQVTHSKIAEEIDKSQPTVGQRIKKLERKGWLDKSCGINLKKANCAIALVNLVTRDTEKVKCILREDSHVLNAFSITGSSNLVALIVHKNNKEIYSLVQDMFNGENNKYVNSIEFNIVTSLLKDLVMPIN